jgi:hypothetical protein
MIDADLAVTIWVLPVFGYLRYVDRVDVLGYLQLKQHWRRGVVIGLTMSVVNFVGTMARIGHPVWSSAHVTWNSILGTSIRTAYIFAFGSVMAIILRYPQSLWAPPMRRRPCVPCGVGSRYRPLGHPSDTRLWSASFSAVSRRCSANA